MKKVIALTVLFIIADKASAQRKTDTVKLYLLVYDTTKLMGLRIEPCYSVREWHNEAEGVIDWGFSYPQRTPEDYPVHIKYLDYRKQPLKNKLFWKPENVNP